MEIYRTNAAEKLELAAAPKPSKRRTLAIAALSIAAHAALLGGAFAARSAAPAETTRVVRVLVGHVDETGSFQARGLADARVKR